MEETIIQLQTLVEYQREELATLSAELYNQHKELARLKQQMTELVDKISALESEGGAQDAADEPPPPHY